MAIIQDLLLLVAIRLDNFMLTENRFYSYAHTELKNIGSL